MIMCLIIQFSTLYYIIIRTSPDVTIKMEANPSYGLTVQDIYKDQ